MGEGEACGDREMGNLSVKNGSTGTEVGNRETETEKEETKTTEGKKREEESEEVRLQGKKSLD